MTGATGPDAGGEPNAGPDAGAGAERRTAKAHVFVADVDRPAVDPADRRHLDRVLRLRPGDPVTVSDGAGRWRPFRWGPVLEPTGEARVDPRPSMPVTVAFAPVKGDRPEWAVQKLTELGVDRIVPFIAARSVVRWDVERSDRAVERLRRVALQAAMQSRRTWLPEIEEATTFSTLAGRAGAALAVPHGRPPWVLGGPILIGPEGGWAPEELGSGLPCMTLGTEVLRAETAAVTAAVLLTALRGLLVSERPPGGPR